MDGFLRGMVCDLSQHNIQVYVDRLPSPAEWRSIFLVFAGSSSFVHHNNHPCVRL